MVIGWNATGREYPRGKRIDELFEAQAVRSAEAVALIDGGERLSYGEVNRRANQVGRYLRERGVRRGSLVGIAMERSVDLIVGILGILKAGGAYVPLDPSYPQERLKYILGDTGAAVILTQQRHMDSLPQSGAEVVCLDRDRQEIGAQSGENLGIEGVAEDLAYVMYTSGSTGVPKGVEVPHRGVVRLLFGVDYVRLDAEQRFLHLAPTSFDASTFEIWGSLLHGGQCVLYPGRVPSPFELGELLHKHEINTLWLTASLFNAVIDGAPEALSGVRQLLIGGEALSVPHVRRALALLPQTQIINGYGPTESTTFTCCYSIPRQLEENLSSIPIGKPIGNTEVYILDSQLHPVPIGVAGELYIGGDGLARGYLNQPELTAEKFIEHPFSEDSQARLYKTGDRVRYLADGNIEFLERLDNQVKIRGYRIELGEIEAVLNEHSGVSQSVVAVREDTPGDKRLVAYVVPKLDKNNSQTGGQDRSLERQYIAEWQELYEQLYRQPSPEGSDCKFNIIGWNSSYTGEPIPAAEMREWRDCTIRRIEDFNPRRVLEIGCGTGLILAGLAPHCETYVGTDFSPAAIDHVQNQILAEEELSHVVLLRQPADEFSVIGRQKFDTVILNSVTQYLPSMEYLRRVLRGAVEVLETGGRIFVGDVRSLPLLRMFHASVEYSRAADNLNRQQTASRISQAMDLETELVIDPMFFAGMRSLEPRISDVDILMKRGKCHNELTSFRYDVILHVEGDVEPVKSDRRLDWERDNLSLGAIRASLSSGKFETLEVVNVPNARLCAESAMLSWLLAEAGPENIGALRHSLRSNLWNAVDPETVWCMAEELNYRAELRDSAALGSFDALFRNVATAQGSPAHWYREELNDVKQLCVYGNNPLRPKSVDPLVPTLRQHLSTELPEYMVPRAFVLLDSLPLTPSGKIDRGTLPAPDSIRPTSLTFFVAPRTSLEASLAEIWTEVLKAENIGIHDNFFDLGGHSLLATQVLARIRRMFQMELPLQTIFEEPTIEGLATVISDRNTAKERELERIVAELELTSDEDPER